MELRGSSVLLTGATGGIGHAMKVGFNWIHEPHLFITFNTGKGVVQYTHLDNTLTGPIATLNTARNARALGM